MDTNAVAAATGGERCGLCGHGGLDASREVILGPAATTCGVRVHLRCFRSRLRAAEPLATAASAAGASSAAASSGGHAGSGLALFSEENLAALRLFEEEASQNFERYPTELELCVGRELTLRRPVTLLSKIPDVVFSFEGLRCLEFTGHSISEIPSDIAKLRSLKRLVLVSLYIRSLPAEICDMQSIEQLYVSGCPLRELPARIGSLQRLRRFYADSDKLRALPDPLPPQLDGLKVSGNMLERLPEGLGACWRMGDIMANGNRLLSVPSSIGRLTSLRHVMLHGNRLRSLPDTIGDLPLLESLLVHDNHLERLPDAVCKLPRLEWLYAYNNQLKDLPPGLARRLSHLERLLVENNPLSEQAMVDLLTDVPTRLRLFGVDDSQLATWQRAVGQDAEPPRRASGGRMLPWGRLYAKLTHASRLSSRAPPVVAAGEAGSSLPRELPSTQSTLRSSDVLVVAFSASQGEPEWLGQLGQIIHLDPAAVATAASAADLGASDDDGAAAPAAGAAPQRVRRRKRCLAEVLAAEAGPRGEQPSAASAAAAAAAGARAASALWSEWCDGEEAPPPPPDGAPSRVRDFDVLSLVDTNAQWYTDEPEAELGLEAKLRGLVAEYRRVLFLGVSMGGFGALSNAHLADTVAVFGPQTDLTIAHLRPGWGQAALTDATAKMRDSVRTALRRGTRIENHVAMEDHLILARRLPLPPGSIIVHPVAGRIARLLERGGLLAPLLAGLVRELQAEGCPRPCPASLAFADSPALGDAAGAAWEWSDAAGEDITLARWRPDIGLEHVRASPSELADLCASPPSSGSWYCRSCFSKNDDDKTRCSSGCQADTMPKRRRVAAAPRQPRQKKLHQCRTCWSRHERYAPRCPDCGGALELICDFCSGAFDDHGGRPEPVENKWYCNECWAKFRRHSAALRRELPEGWFLEGEGGQVWRWSEGLARSSGGNGGGRCGMVEFDRRGMFRTSWGEGSWSVEGAGGYQNPPPPRATLRVEFGLAKESWLLARTNDGFLARRSACSSAASSSWAPSTNGAKETAEVALGTPLYLESCSVPSWRGGASALLRRFAGGGGLARWAAVVAMLCLIGARPARDVFRKLLASGRLRHRWLGLGGGGGGGLAGAAT